MRSVYAHIYDPTTAPHIISARQVKSLQPPSCIPAIPNISLDSQPVVPRLNLEGHMPSISVTARAMGQETQPFCSAKVKPPKTCITEPLEGPLTDRILTTVDRASQDCRRHLAMVRYLRGEKGPATARPVPPPSAPHNPNPGGPPPQDNKKTTGAALRWPRHTGGTHASDKVGTAPQGDNPAPHHLFSKEEEISIVLKRGEDIRRKLRERETVYMQDYSSRALNLTPRDPTAAVQKAAVRAKDNSYHNQPSRYWTTQEKPIPGSSRAQPPPYNAWRNIFPSQEILRHSSNVLSHHTHERHQRELRNMQMPAAGVATSLMDVRA